MKRFKIICRPTVPFEELNKNDQGEYHNLMTRQEFDAESEDEALDQFHNQQPIKVLDHWKITVAETWLDHSRIDLKSIPMMREHGYEPEFAYEDERNVRTTAENCPHFPVNFKKGNIVIWQIKNAWQTADLIEGSYRYHHTCYTLEEAVEYKLTNNRN